ncbi:MAG: Gfo/Idh/MocA family protein [Victivallaceae bacterium]|nr:hypothetical protein [Victivallaceae bacterium]
MLNVALIGADSSHTVEYSRRMADPEFDRAQRVFELNPTRCFAWPTPFQNADGIAARMRMLAGLGVKAAGSLEEALCGADAVMVEANNPADHLALIRKTAIAGLPVFLDKPLADSYANGLAIAGLVRQSGIAFFSSSPLRFAAEVQAMHRRHPAPRRAEVVGALGKAAAGSDVVWYGVHAFEIAETLMGRGARCASCTAEGDSLIFELHWPNDRSGRVELRRNHYAYSGTVDDESFAVNAPNAEFYGETIKQVEKFFLTGIAPVELEDTLEVTRLLDAAAKASFDKGV